MSEYAIIQISTLDTICEKVREIEGSSEPIKVKEINDHIETLGEQVQFTKDLIDGTLTTITPNNLKGITQIKGMVFRNQKELIDVHIPTTIEKIAIGAFQGCDKIEKVVIPFVGTNRDDETTCFSTIFPNTVKEIIITDEKLLPEGAFEDYPTEARVVIKEGLDHIAEHAFAYSNITSVVLPNTLTSIGVEAFCESYLSEIEIPEGVKEIGGAAFYFTDIQTLTIPNSVEILGIGAFEESHSLQTVLLGSGIQHIPVCCFYESENITSIDIPSTVKSIGEEAFAYCGLTKLLLVPGLISIDEGAFLNNKITELVIPNTVTDIRQGTFDGNPIKKLTIPAQFIPNIPQQKLEQVVLTGNQNIPTYALSNAFELKTVVLEGSPKKIGNRAFANCINLIGVILSNSIQQIEDCAFKDCSSLEEISIPSSVTSIALDAFSGCDKLVKIYITGKQAGTIIGAPWGAKYVRVIWSDKEEYYGNPSLGLAYGNNEDKGLYAVMGRGDCTDINIEIPSAHNGNTVEMINGDAFRHEDGLYSITIPGSVNIIGSHAFDSSGLLLANIENGVEEIQAEAFVDSVYGLTIPSSVIRFGDSALNLRSTSKTNNCSFVRFMNKSGVPSNKYACGTGNEETIGTIYVPSGLADEYKNALPDKAGIIEELDYDIIVFTFQNAQAKQQGEITRCFAKRGMTWGEWIASEYNTLGATINIDIIHIPSVGHIATWVDAINQSGHFCLTSEKIIESNHYFLGIEG